MDEMLYGRHKKVSKAIDNTFEASSAAFLSHNAIEIDRLAQSPML